MTKEQIQLLITSLPELEEGQRYVFKPARYTGSIDYLMVDGRLVYSKDGVCTKGGLRSYLEGGAEYIGIGYFHKSSS